LSLAAGALGAYTADKTNAALAEFEPALAVRGSACITCHAKISPTHITDFGYGDPYFFGKPGGAKFGTFDGHIYGDFYGGAPNKTGWLTAEIGKQVVVPSTKIDFDLAAAGARLSGRAEYHQPLKATSLADYLRGVENQKPRPAAVIEKDKVFIGAPDASTLEARFGIAGSGDKLEYIKTDVTSPDLAGIGLASGSFYTNTGEVACDGDLFLRGALFLDNPVISTRRGCRIYTTGPIFLNKNVAYGGGDEANLQLVSAEAIMLGVGDKSCDPKDKESPLSRRLVSGYAVSTFMTREAQRRAVAPPVLARGIYDRGKAIAALQDASCHDVALGFSRLLLNAPQVHSRYRGKFKGVVIAEIALFGRGASASEFEFDPVFKKVPVLPMLKPSDYLQVE
jgi:hypothetical protein